MAGLKKVLLVEDNFYIRDIYNVTLKQAGYELAEAVNSQEAFAKAVSFKPDLILLDIMIPGESGIEVLKKLRTDPQYGSQNTKIILLTNLAQDDASEQAKSANADGYIVKADITPADLIGIIKTLETPS